MVLTAILSQIENHRIWKSTFSQNKKITGAWLRLNSGSTFTQQVIASRGWGTPPCHHKPGPPLCPGFHLLCCLKMQLSGFPHLFHHPSLLYWIIYLSVQRLSSISHLKKKSTANIIPPSVFFPAITLWLSSSPGQPSCKGVFHVLASLSHLPFSLQFPYLLPP